MKTASIFQAFTFFTHREISQKLNFILAISEREKPITKSPLFEEKRALINRSTLFPD